MMAEVDDKLKVKLTNFLKTCMVKPKPQFIWERVVGCDVAKREIYQKVVMPHKLMEYQSGDRIPTPEDVLLEGLNGTGKTRMAFTAAASCQADFFCVINCVEMFSNFGIEASLFIRLAFETAKRHKRSIIYMKNMECFEYDCNWIILPAKSELKHQMTFWKERFRLVNGKFETVSVIGAARNLCLLDMGIITQFRTRVHVPLPNEKQRLQLILMFLGNSSTFLYQKDWQYIVEQTKGYSGRKLKTLCQNAITSTTVFSSIHSDNSTLEETCITLSSFSPWVDSCDTSGCEAEEDGSLFPSSKQLHHPVSASPPQNCVMSFL